jgi:putative tricarboxylic transport membrane protein
MLKAESLIAAALMGLGLYFMWHATVLPIGWVEGQGPGGGAFPFWLSAIMVAAAGVVLVRSLAERGVRQPFFVPAMLRPVIFVALALIITTIGIDIVGAYLALSGFMVWYLRIFGHRGWALTVLLTLATQVFLFFFFEVTLKILLPKGITEPLFFPLYALFF